MSAPPPLLDRELPAGWQVEWYATLASTNDEARRLAEAGRGHGTLVVADRQTAGRGRRGRVWTAVEGNLYCSVLVRSPRPAAEQGCYAFVVANALHEAVEAETGVRTTLKWPNDLLVAGRKLSGILIEALPGSAERLVAGIGLNLVGVPGEMAGRAVALAEIARTVPSRARMVTAIADRLALWHERWRTAGPAPAIEAMRSRTVPPGTPLVVVLGATRIEGVHRDIAADGSLLVRDAHGREHRITTGDVALIG